MKVVRYSAARLLAVLTPALASLTAFHATASWGVSALESLWFSLAYALKFGFGTLPLFFHSSLVFSVTLL